MGRETATERLARVYLRFAEREAHGRSALYEELARGVAGSRPVLELLATLPEPKQQPNPLFAAGGVDGPARRRHRVARALGK